MRGIQLLIAMIRADVYRSGAFGPYAAPALAALGRVVRRALALGALGAAAGVAGSLWHGPATALTILLMAVGSGLIGFLVGAAWGLWRERGRPSPEDAA